MKEKLELPKYINYKLPNDVSFKTIEKVLYDFNESLMGKATLVCNRFEYDYWSLAIQIPVTEKFPHQDDVLALGIYIGNLLNKYQNK